jgi:RES domain-containing protein
VRVWRISPAIHADNAFDGEGAALAGGRWNPPGTPVVYTSETLSLAALEFFINFNSRRPVPLVTIAAEIPEAIEPISIDPPGLPSNWRSHRHAVSMWAVGEGWVRAAESAVLSVPSVLIPQERNYLLNPAHRDFKKIRVGKPERFSFDPRMWK